MPDLTYKTTLQNTMMGARGSPSRRTLASVEQQTIGQWSIKQLSNFVIMGAREVEAERGSKLTALETKLEVLVGMIERQQREALQRALVDLKTLLKVYSLPKKGRGTCRAFISIDGRVDLRVTTDSGVEVHRGQPTGETIRFRGAYDEKAYYWPGDHVVRNGSTWICRKAGKGNPVVDGKHFRLYTQRGQRGSRGRPADSMVAADL